MLCLVRGFFLCRLLTSDCCRRLALISMKVFVRSCRNHDINCEVKPKSRSQFLSLTCPVCGLNSPILMGEIAHMAATLGHLQAWRGDETARNWLRCVPAMCSGSIRNIFIEASESALRHGNTPPSRLWQCTTASSDAGPSRSAHPTISRAGCAHRLRTRSCSATS